MPGRPAKGSLDGIGGEVDLVLLGGLIEAVLGDGLEGFRGDAEAHEAVALVPPELAVLEVDFLDLVVTDVRKSHRPRLRVAPLTSQVTHAELHLHGRGHRSSLRQRLKRKSSPAISFFFDGKRRNTRDYHRFLGLVVLFS